MTSGRLLARNSALNLFSQSLPVLAALIAIPPLVRGLGEGRFGVLTLAWAAIGYFSFFEMGLGKALTQAVAQRLGNGSQEELPGLTRTALVMLFVLGIVGGVIFAGITPTLTTRVLKIPAALQGETIISFWILAGVLPFVFTTVGIRGLMEAHQHFGTSTLLRVPLAALTFIGPLVVLPFSRSLVPAVAMLAAVRILAFVLHLWVCARKYTFLSLPAHFQRAPAMALLRFGGWSTVSNVVSPMMVYLDRFVIGTMLTVAAVGYYVTPYEVVVKLLIIPVSLTGVLFPAFAASVTKNPARAAELYEKMLRAIMLATFPVALVAVVLAREGMSLWMGSVLPVDSAIVAQWLAVGVFLTAIAQTPLTALQGAGRPDLIAKLHIAELPFYIGGLLALTQTLGLPGVALAWTLRAAVDAAALFWIAHRQLQLPLMPRLGGFWSLVILLGLMAGGALLETVQVRVIYVAAVLAAFGTLGWLRLLTAGEREAIRAWLNVPRAPREALEEPT